MVATFNSSSVRADGPRPLPSPSLDDRARLPWRFLERHIARDGLGRG